MQFTTTQIQRLRNLGCPLDDDLDFETAEERNAAFKNMERFAIKANRSALRSMRENRSPVLVNELAQELSAFLRNRGFMEVSTPITIPAVFLERMGIGGDHDLHDQVFWIDSKTCLRPMLAPGLYDISRKLIDILGAPLAVFEVGPCFRKESRGSRHLECFTMLNFVEWGIPEEEKHDRARQLVADVMGEMGLEYELVEEDSTVYGKTFDVVVEGDELASGAFGPHPLDPAWSITETWLGVGIGLERAVCMREGINNIQRVGRSLAYHNGIGLNFK